MTFICFSIPLIKLTWAIPCITQFQIDIRELAVFRTDYLKELSGYIDTTKLLSYSTSLKQIDIDSSFKYYKNVRLFDSRKTEQYLIFSKPLFWGNSYCYIELEYISYSGVGYFYLLNFSDNKWQIVLKRQTWIQ